MMDDDSRLRVLTTTMVLDEITPRIRSSKQGDSLQWSSDRQQQHKSAQPRHVFSRAIVGSLMKSGTHIVAAVWLVLRITGQHSMSAVER